jgi:hypothetical protein
MRGQDEKLLLEQYAVRGGERSQRRERIAFECVQIRDVEPFEYPGLDRSAVVAGSLSAVTDWTRGRLANAVPSTACAT